MTIGEVEDTRRRPIPVDTFAGRLKLTRLHAGDLTIMEAAERCGLLNQSWSNWERGSHPRDLLDVAATISEELDVDFDWLLRGGALSSPRRRVKATEGYAVRKPHASTRPASGRPGNRADLRRPAINPRRLAAA